MSRVGARRRPRLLCRSVGLVLTCACLLASASVADARLTFKRPDDSAIGFKGKPHAWCGPWEPDVARRSVHVELTNAKRHWELSVVRRDVSVGEPLTFPNSFVWNRPHGAELFVAYARNEASTATEKSSGSMTFSHVGCHLDDLVAFHIEAVIGSEFSNGRPVHVSGSYRGRVGERP